MRALHTAIRLLCAFAAVATLASCAGDSTDGTDGRDATGAAPPADAAERPLQFVQEYVIVEPSPGLTRVVGVYHIRNATDRRAETGIIYPFPVDRDHAPPHTVRVWEMTDEGYRTKGFIRRDADFLMTLDLAPQETRVFRVEYVQRIRKRQAVYIVTTTQQWERAIDIAEFEFRVPAALEGVELSFEPDRTEDRGDTLVHFMRQEGFFPTEDLVVTWTGER